MGSHDGVEVLLGKLSNILEKKNTDLYKDEGLFVIDN